MLRNTVHQEEHHFLTGCHLEMRTTIHFIYPANLGRLQVMGLQRIKWWVGTNVVCREWNAKADQAKIEDLI